MTGLLNRSSLQDQFLLFAARARRNEGFALFYLDLDNFKQINDTYGHRTGDAVIVEIASRISTTIREIDVGARIGGDEFVVLQSNLTCMQDVVGLTKRLIAAINLPFELEGEVLIPGASIGICTSLTSSGNFDFDSMIDRPDSEMYEAKSEAKGKFVLQGCLRKTDNCSFGQCDCFTPTLQASKSFAADVN